MSLFGTFFGLVLLMPSDRPNGEKQYLKEKTTLGKEKNKNRQPW